MFGPDYGSVDAFSVGQPPDLTPCNEGSVGVPYTSFLTDSPNDIAINATANHPVTDNEIDISWITASFYGSEYTTDQIATPTEPFEHTDPDPPQNNNNLPTRRRDRYPPRYVEDPSAVPTRSVCVTRWNSMAAQKILSLSTLDTFYLSKTVQRIQLIAERVAFARLCLFYIHATVMGLFISVVSFCDAVCGISNLAWCIGWFSRSCMFFNCLVLLTGLGLASTGHVPRSIRCVHGMCIILAVSLTFMLDAPPVDSCYATQRNISLTHATVTAQQNHTAFWLLTLNKLSYVIVLGEGACGAFLQSLASI